MKKHLFSTLFIIGVTTVGYAQNASHISENNASDATQIRMRPALSSGTSAVDATTKMTSESHGEAIRIETSRFVLTNEEADVAIAKVEQQMAENEGTEGFVKEDYLRKIAILNKRRPTTTTPK